MAKTREHLEGQDSPASGALLRLPRVLKRQIVFLLDDHSYFAIILINKAIYADLITDRNTRMHSLFSNILESKKIPRIQMIFPHICMTSNAECVKKAIELKVDTLSTHKNSYPIELAARHGSLPIVNLLLAAKDYTKESMRALDISLPKDWMNTRNNYEKIITTLVEKKVSLIDTLGRACHGRDINAIQMLLENKVDPNARMRAPTYGGHYVLTAAVATGDKSVVRLLLDKKASPTANEASFRSCETLAFACHNSDDETINILLDAKADPHLGYIVVSGSGDVYPLDGLACRGNLTILRRLIEENVSLADMSFDKSGIKAACKNLQVEVVELLLANKVKPKNRQSSGSTLPELVLRLRNPSTVKECDAITKLLLDNKADLLSDYTEDSKPSENPLSKALVAGDTQHVEFLMPYVTNKRVLHDALKHWLTTYGYSLSSFDRVRPPFIESHCLKLFLDNKPEPPPSAFYLVFAVLKSNSSYAATAEHYIALIMDPKYKLDINEINMMSFINYGSHLDAYNDHHKNKPSENLLEYGTLLDFYNAHHKNKLSKNFLESRGAKTSIEVKAEAARAQEEEKIMIEKARIESEDLQKVKTLITLFAKSLSSPESTTKYGFSIFRFEAKNNSAKNTLIEELDTIIQASTSEYMLSKLVNSTQVYVHNLIKNDNNRDLKVLCAFLGVAKLTTAGEINVDLFKQVIARGNNSSERSFTAGSGGISGKA